MQEQGCYIKKNSFHELHVSNGKTSPEIETMRARKIIKNYLPADETEKIIFNKISSDLKGGKKDSNKFSVSPFVADEMHSIADIDIQGIYIIDIDMKFTPKKKY